MCESNPIRLEQLVRHAVSGVSDLEPSAVIPLAPPSNGSRRRRLWELQGRAHCPVIGVCMPMAALRRLADKLSYAEAVTGDYELHCSVVAECKLRTPVAEAVQRELDRRHMFPLRQAAKIKTSDALAAWWREASEGKDLAGAFWATLTHPRCTPALEDQVLGEVHMLQHQVGMARRIDAQRFEALIDENAVLARELAAAQRRRTHETAEQTARSEAQQAEIVRLRAELIGRDTSIATLQEELHALRAAVPHFKERTQLVRDNERLLERTHDLHRALMQAQQEAERQRRRADELASRALRDAASAPREADASEPRDAGVSMLREAIPSEPRDPLAPASRERAASEPLTSLDDLAVLCVGGRSGSVPIFRDVIERTGARFLHHDGGEEDSAAKLESTLAAADLVICQTGCISHCAYWRVKDHCKRTGKRCVFVETPSATALRRALTKLPSAAVDRAGS